MGIDDYIYIVMGLITIYLLKFWLSKIYYRVRQIAKICEHFLKEDRKKGL